VVTWRPLKYLYYVPNWLCEPQFRNIQLCTYNWEIVVSKEYLDTCISGSIASPNEKAMVPRALKALKDLDAELPCKL